MNKFILMIFSVSVFFIGVGGIVKQIGFDFRSGKTHLVMIPRIETENDEREKISELKTFTLTDKSKSHLLIDGKKIEESDFQIQVRTPVMPDHMIELRRRPAAEPLKQGVELPRVDENDTLIFLKKTGEQIDLVEEHGKSQPRVKVFIDKKAK